MAMMQIRSLSCSISPTFYLENLLHKYILMYASMLILFSHFLGKPLFFGSYFGDFDALSPPGGGLPPLKLQFGKGGGGCSHRRRSRAPLHSVGGGPFGSKGRGF